MQMVQALYNNDRPLKRTFNVMLAVSFGTDGRCISSTYRRPSHCREASQLQNNI